MADIEILPEVLRYFFTPRPAPAIVIEDPPVTSEPQPTSLADLFIWRTVSPGTVASRFGLDALLFERIDRGRQPMPRALAIQIGAFLGVPTGTVLAASHLVTDSTDPRHFRPLPPDLARGDTMPSLQLTRTVQQPNPTGATPLGVLGWVSDVAAATTVRRFDRSSGAMITSVTLTNVGAVGDLVLDGSYVWALGQFLTPTAYIARFNASAGTLDFEATDPAYGLLLSGIAFGGSLWLCNASGTPELTQADPTTGLRVAGVQFSELGNPITPNDVIEVGGLLYVAATFDDGLGTSYGRVYEVDPGTLTILRTSTGANLMNARSLASDGVKIWVVSGTSTAGPPDLYEVPIGTFIAASFALVGASEPLGEPYWVEYLAGLWWIGEQSSGTTSPRVYKVNGAANVQEERTFAAPGGAPGRLTYDGSFLWYASFSTGDLLVIDPASLLVDVLVIPTGLVMPFATTAL